MEWRETSIEIPVDSSETIDSGETDIKSSQESPIVNSISQKILNRKQNISRLRKLKEKRMCC